MVKRIRLSIVFCAVASIMLAACQSEVGATTSTANASAAALPRASKVSRTEMPSAVPTLMLTLTPTNTPDTTPIPVPTLTGEQQDMFLENMLETNGGCELPCWWGGTIVPGETTLGEAKRFFHSQGIPYLVRSGIVDVVFQVPYPVGMDTWEYNSRIIVTSQDGRVVQSVKVMGDTYSREPTPRFAHVWSEHYKWDRILSRLGMPSQVLFLTSPETYAAPAGYDLTIAYEGASMLISYAGPAQEIGANKTRACPRFDQVTQIELRLVSSEEGSLLGPMNKYDLCFVDWCRVFKETAQGKDFDGYFNQVFGEQAAG